MDFKIPPPEKWRPVYDWRILVGLETETDTAMIDFRHLGDGQIIHGDFVHARELRDYVLKVVQEHAAMKEVLKRVRDYVLYALDEELESVEEDGSDPRDSAIDEIRDDLKCIDGFLP